MSVDDKELMRASTLNLQGEHAEAYSIFEKQAEAGSGYAAVQLGYMCQVGIGAPLNLARAKSWYAKARALNEPRGGYYLALMDIEEGNLGSAFEEMKDVASTGFLPAIFRLGQMYSDGVGCDVDRIAADHYRMYAATHGHLFAKRWQGWELVKKGGLAQRLRGLFLVLVATVEIFWYTLRRPNDPRAQG